MDPYADCTRKASANLITQAEKPQDSADMERNAKDKLVFSTTKTDIQINDSIIFSVNRHLKLVIRKRTIGKTQDNQQQSATSTGT